MSLKGAWSSQLYCPYNLGSIFLQFNKILMVKLKAHNYSV